MASVNKVILIGNAGRDPETRVFPNGDSVTNVSIATSRKWKDKTSGELQEETEWHRLTFYGRVAEIAAEYVTKGKSIYVEGRLRTRKYQKDGVDHFATEVVCDQLQLLGSKDDGTRADRPAAPVPAPKPRTASGTGFDDMDDDIPF